MDKPNYYAVLTAEVRYNKNLCANAKLLYAEITALTNLNSNCYATDSYFAQLYDVDRRTIQLWLSELEKNNLIKRVIKYKKNSKEIESRFISLPIPNKSSTPLLNKNSLPYGKNIHYPTEEIFVENTTLTESNINPTDSNIIPPTPKDFENELLDFWNSYIPVAGRDGRFVSKGNKQLTLDKLKKLLKNGENYENIKSGLASYLRYCQANCICTCGATVFINQRRWEDDYTTAQRNPNNASNANGGNRQETISLDTKIANFLARN